jgi:formylglycine-generating enzyme required for sulfatase activity
MPLLLLLAALLLAFPGEAVTLDWILVNEPGNPAEVASNCLGAAADCGSVPQLYHIAKTELTNAQYAEFLNAVAEADPNGLYNPAMGSDARGGITRSGGGGNYSYAVKSGRANEPVVFVSFYDGLRFANWLHNAQPTGAQGAGTTEGGAYTLTPAGVAGNSIARNGGAQFFLPSENEWYKAAYYDPALDLYYNTPTGTDLAPQSDPPPGGPDSANIWEGTYALTGSAILEDGFDYLTPVGAYTAAASPFGTFDQAGNVWEWSETIDGANRGIRGGGWNDGPTLPSASIALSDDPTLEQYDVGLRLATVPEPGQLLLVATGALTLAAARSRRA